MIDPISSIFDVSKRQISTPYSNIEKIICKDLDKASQKGVMHKNNVARKKSKLAKKLNSK